VYSSTSLSDFDYIVCGNEVYSSTPLSDFDYIVSSNDSNTPLVTTKNIVKIT
jgi:hypothetical protein